MTEPSQYDVVVAVRRMLMRGAAAASTAQDLHAMADATNAYTAMQDWLGGGPPAKDVPRTADP